MLSWIVEGAETSLDDRTLCYMLGHDGLGMWPFHRLEERGPMQNGVTDRGYRLDPRMVMLAVGIKGDDLGDYYDKRAQLEGIFKPRNAPGILKWTYDGSTRYIQGYCVGGLEWDIGGRENLYHKAVISIRCPDPRWYDPTVVSIIFALSGGWDSGKEVPFDIPFTIGTPTLDLSQAITYFGSVRSYPTIRITGPITDPVITHVLTGYKLDFTGTTISSGDYIIIDLGYAENTIIDQDGTHQDGILTTDSDLTEFALLPSPDAPGGTQTITATGTAITSVTSIRMTYYNYY